MAARKTTTTKAKSTAKAKTTATKTASKAKTTTAKPAMAKVVAAPKPTLVETVKPVVTDTPIKKPELIERVMAETGMKKKDVKPVVEAMLTVIGRSLSDGEEMIVPPLGKVMIKHTKDVANAKIINVKIRHPQSVEAPKTPLAEPAE